MGTLLQSCLKVHEVIELPFGVVNGVDPGIGVLDGGPHFPQGRGSFGVLRSIGFNGISEFICKREMYLTRE